jgi:hypothetical protein
MPVRHLCSQLVSVLCGAGNYRPRVFFANLEEISEWKAFLLVEQPVRRGTKVQVTCESNQLSGTVESCKLDNPLGFIVSIRLDPESRWSEKWFTPNHLLAIPDHWQPKALHLGVA